MKRLIIIVLIVAAFMLPGCRHAGPYLVGGILGFLIGAAASHPPPSYYAPPYAHPSQCFREVPEHWEMRWDPYRNAYAREWIPRHYVRIPCQ